jgi:hypothetical protein
MRRGCPEKPHTREEIQRLRDLGLKFRGESFKGTATYRKFQIKLEWGEN